MVENHKAKVERSVEKEKIIKLKRKIEILKDKERKIIEWKKKIEILKDKNLKENPVLEYLFPKQLFEQIHKRIKDNINNCDVWLVLPWWPTVSCL